MSRLAFEAIAVAFGKRKVLDGISGVLAPGQVTVILGPNGAGKSTLLAALAGLRRPDGGRVRLDDRDIFDLRPRLRAQRMAFLPQTPEITWAVEARILVGLGRTPFIGARGLSADDAVYIEAALKAADALDLADRDVASLSGGERARVLIARALAGQPEWLLADEPLTGLDLGHQLDALTLFRALARTNGCGIVLTLHDLALAGRFADRVIVLADGQILADGVPDQALTPPVIAAAYGVRADVGHGPSGLNIDILGRVG
ncbi:MAG: ABC transporter [Phenylobacterium zucineum]|nr:MAG: ABC transporter [Phenylobacterium zucineum]